MRLDEVLLRGARAEQPPAGDVPPGTLYFVVDEAKTERGDGAAWQDVSDVTAIPPPPALDVAALHLRTTRATQPSASAAPPGTLCFVLDENKTERSTGTAWESYSDVTVIPAIPPMPAQVHLLGTRAAQPTAASAGNGALYFVTNEGKLERSDGSAWQAYAPQTLRGSSGARPAATAVPTGTLYHSTDNGNLNRSNGSAWEDMLLQPQFSTQRGTRAAQPAASPAGRLYYVADEGKLERASGAAWEEFGWVPDAGVFTPAIQFGGATTGITHSLQVGRYLAIGPWVLFNLQATLSSKGTAVGYVEVTGFPFTDVGMFSKSAVAIQIDGTTGVTIGIHAAMGATGVIQARFANGSTVTDANLSATSTVYMGGVVLRNATVPF